MDLITVQRAPDAPFEMIDPSLLDRLDGVLHNAHEHTTWTEYREHGKLVHRSAHVRLKQWPEGLSGGLGRLGSHGMTPSDSEPGNLSTRHLHALAHLRLGGVRFANAQAMCTQFKADILNGLHAMGASVIRGATTKDAYKAALYLVSASRGAADTIYSATGEVSGTGYSAGGVAVTTAIAPNTSGTTAFFTPSASFVFTTVTLSTAFDAVLLYNDTSSTKLAVAVFTFGSQTVTAGTFTITMPTNDSTNGLIRIA